MERNVALAWYLRPSSGACLQLRLDPPTAAALISRAWGNLMVVRLQPMSDRHFLACARTRTKDHVVFGIDNVNTARGATIGIAGVAASAA